MPRTPARVTQADIARVLRAVKDAGVDMRVEIAPDGTIRLEPADRTQGKVDTNERWVP
jgi:hypothetical protein